MFYLRSFWLVLCILESPNAFLTGILAWSRYSLLCHNAKTSQSSNITCCGVMSQPSNLWYYLLWHIMLQQKIVWYLIVAAECHNQNVMIPLVVPKCHNQIVLILNCCSRSRSKIVRSHTVIWLHMTLITSLHMTLITSHLKTMLHTCSTKLVYLCRFYSTSSCYFMTLHTCPSFTSSIEYVEGHFAHRYF